MPNRPEQHVSCPRCDIALDYVGTRKFHEGTRAFDVLGGIFELFKNREHFEALHAYSPYHRVVEGTAYPPTLFLTGANDPRVDPMQSRKMTARLQAANPRGQTLLRTSADTGHGSGTPLAERIAREFLAEFVPALIARASRPDVLETGPQTIR